MRVEAEYSNYSVSLILVLPGLRPPPSPFLARQLPLDPSKNHEKPLVFKRFCCFGLSWTPPGPQTLPESPQDHLWSTFEALLELLWMIFGQLVHDFETWTLSKTNKNYTDAK